MASVYVIIKGTFPDKYEPVGVAGNADLAKREAEKYVKNFNVEIQGQNKHLKNEMDNGAKIPEYELKKLLKPQGVEPGYWGNDMDFVMYKQMELISQ